MSKSVLCLATSEAHAQRITHGLTAAGFPASDISVLFPDRSGTRDFAHEQGTKSPEGAIAGVGAGGALGGALGWAIGLGALAIPGVGPFIAAGPLMAALAGAAVGAAVGGVTGSLIGLGIPEFEAKRYAGKITSGKILVAVHTDDSKAIERAKAVYRDAGAEDIAVAGEAAVGEGGHKALDRGHPRRSDSTTDLSKR